MRYFLIYLVALIIAASSGNELENNSHVIELENESSTSELQMKSDVSVEKKRSKDRKKSANSWNEFKDVEYSDAAYESSPAKPVSKPSEKPAIVTQTGNDQSKPTLTKESSSTNSVKTEISNKYVTIYPTIQAPSMEGNAPEKKHPYLYALVAITIAVMLLGYV